jgi:hypothetical protein
MKSGKREGKGALTRGESTCKQEVKGRRFQIGKGLALRITAVLKKHGRYRKHLHHYHKNSKA